MTTSTQLEIPADLKPADGRFGCGPSKVRPDALARLEVEVVSARRARSRAEYTRFRPTRSGRSRPSA